MKYSWEKVGEGREAHHVLTVDEKPAAVIWLQYGFVERPDSWILKLKGQHDTSGYEILEAAKRAAEDEFVGE